MINFNDITNRKRCLNKKMDNSINISMLEESAMLGNDVHLEELLLNYKQLSYNESVAFLKAIDILNEYAESMNQSKINKASLFLENRVLPGVKDIKQASIDIQERLSDKYDKNALYEACENIKVCDRIIKNHDKLKRSSSFGQALSECVMNDLNNDLKIMEFCKIIDSYNMKDSIKMNVALENVIYGIQENNITGITNSEAILAMYEYFTFKGFNKDTFAKLIVENKLISENDKVSLLEFKGSSFDKLLDDVAEIRDGKDAKTMEAKLKTAIRKCFTRSDKQILDEMPNLFRLIRAFIYGIMVTGGPLTAVTAVILCITDVIVSSNLQRKVVANFIKKYKAERDKLEKSIKTNTKLSKRDEAEKLIKQMDEEISKLEDYEEGLYSEKENDERNGFTESSLLTPGADKFLNKQIYVEPIDVDDYLEHYHTDMVVQLHRAYQAVKALIQRQYKWLEKDEAIQISPIEDMQKFQLVNKDNLTEYIGIDGDDYLNIELATLLPLNIKDKNKITNIRDILDDVCEAVQQVLPKNYCVIFEGDSEMYKIFMVMNIPIIFDNVDDTIHESLRTSINKIIQLDSLLINESDDVVSSLNRLIDNIHPEAIVELCKVAKDDICVDNQELIETLREAKERAYKLPTKFNKYLIADCINECVSILSESRACELNTIDDYINKLNYHNELCSIINTIDDDLRSPLTETSFLNTIKMIRTRVAAKTKNLSDKEKALSRQLDGNLEKLNDSIQKATIEKSREKIIKGNVLPSASNIIKGAIAAGTAFMISPAIAVVGILGSMAISKHMNKQQKQYILDEIDVNLKIIEKKMQLAESNNDMKSLEQLLKLEKKLKRERQRILYNMKAYYNDVSRTD